MGKEFCIEPRTVPHVSTRFRRIVTPIPHPESTATIERLRQFEPLSMRGQPPVVWDRAQNIQVYDKHGNMWLDWSSGVLVANAGHAAPEVRQAILDQTAHGLLHNYCFPSEKRADLVERLAGLAPEGLKKVFLLTTGAEATECAIKLMRASGLRRGGPAKTAIVSFDRGFHGRTLGAQLAGGMAAQKSWIVNPDPGFIQVPFPDGYWTGDTRFDGFLEALAAQGATPDRVAGVLMETYQGVGPDFAPPEYVHALARWCRTHDILLTFDEVQAGFGRTGKFWAFDHYGETPDLICCGKGITSSLPLSAVIGRAEVMDQFPPGSMTSTHTGNPVCAAAALASIGKILREDLTGNAARLEAPLLAGLKRIQAKHPAVAGHVSARGLVAGLQIVMPGEKKPNHDLAHSIVERCCQKGLLLFSPVGAWGQTVKIAPPLTLPLAALEEGLSVLSEAVDEAAANAG